MLTIPAALDKQLRIYALFSLLQDTKIAEDMYTYGISYGNGIVSIIFGEKEPYVPLWLSRQLCVSLAPIRRKLNTNDRKLNNKIKIQVIENKFQFALDELVRKQ
jgi:hypothetical protein